MMASVSNGFKWAILGEVRRVCRSSDSVHQNQSGGDFPVRRRALFSHKKSRMVAHTSVQLIRPGKPPPLTGPLLAEAVWDIVNTGIVGHQVGQVVQLRYGKRVDVDKKPTIELRASPSGEMVRTEDYQWDVEQDFGATDSVLRHLQTHGDPVYRAYVGLGELDDAIATYLTPPPHPSNPASMSLATVALEAGAINVGGRKGSHVFVGWLAFTLSGRGLPSPWSEQELIGRVRSLGVVQSIETMLAQRWPVTQTPGFFERLAWKRIATRIQPAFPARPSWMWGVTTE
jgi:hypothetical protein